jgi:O-antigen ligase
MIEVLIYVFFLTYLVFKKDKSTQILSQVFFFQLIGYLPFLALGIWDLRWLNTVILLGIFFFYKVWYRFPLKILIKNIFHPINISIICILLMMFYHLNYNFVLVEGFDTVNKFIFPTYTLSFIVLISFSKFIEIEHLVEGIIIGGAVTCLLLLTQLGTGVIETSNRHSIESATAYNAITVARTMGMIFFVSIIMLIKKYKLKKFKYLYMLNIICSIFFILITSTRAVIISLSIILLIFFLINSKSFKDALKFFFFTLVISLFAIIFMEVWSFSVLTRFEALNDYEKLARYDGYFNAIQVFKNNIEIGAGPRGYFRLTGRQYPHNLILEVLSEYGAMGGIFLLTILTYSFKIVFKKLKHSNLFIQIIKLTWVYFFLNTMTSGYIASNREFWILCVLLVVISNLENKLTNIYVQRK